MSTFSERYGYSPIDNAIVKGQLTKELQNSICSAFDMLHLDFHNEDIYGELKYMEIEREIWTHFLNERYSSLENSGLQGNLITSFITNQSNLWYRKINMVEFVVKYLNNKYDKGYRYYQSKENFINYLNKEFERHRYAYRIIGNSILEITADYEIDSIKSALYDSNDNIKLHLSRALDAFSKRPNSDNVSSIKESISAVEALCREISGEDSLGKALKKLEQSGIHIHPRLKSAFEQLYAYTNQPNTGIRHALMESDEKYIPANAEARYMLVVCSAFINYLNIKTNIEKPNNIGQ